MAEAKQDLRIQKTQRALATAMLTLLEKSSFGKITVNDLCTEAMVSRSAFYSHFEDKYALLRFCVEMWKQRMFASSQDLDMRGRICDVLAKTQENARIIQNLLMAEMDVELMDMMRRSLQQDFEKLLQEREGKALPGPMDVVSIYYAAAITHAILYWLSANMPYSVEEMAECLFALLPSLD